jgi:NAD(P)-dependent dehydrogenase (short-subunit alcohol dehydrogenase family)
VVRKTAAMLGFTKSLAHEVGRTGVTVNAVASGFIETELTASLVAEDRGTIAVRAALRRQRHRDRRRWRDRLKNRPAQGRAKWGTWTAN